ncbi:hypothetical protein ACS5PN_26785 [Roseateles sp. NT4]|uniref:hypothetical protein n=1 Tax=Roseateles sp. NT4 TaxID=3453715 RepID=UPI003EEC3C1E
MDTIQEMRNLQTQSQAFSLASTQVTAGITNSQTHANLVNKSYETAGEIAKNVANSMKDVARQA